MNEKPSVFKKIMNGTKAGAIAGLIISILSFPINYYVLGIKYADEIALALGRTSYTPSIEGLTVISVNTAIVLTVCGILYGLLYEKLPGNKPFHKGFTLGLAIFIISRIGDMIIDYAVSQSLVFDNALFSAPLLLLLYPYMLSKLYRHNKKHPA